MRQLAESVHISRANAYAQVERLTKFGVITGCTATVSPSPTVPALRRTSR
ncbi:hypothetical protein [Actinomadura formosensis]